MKVSASNRHQTFLYFDLGWTLVDESPAMKVRAETTCARLGEAGVQIDSDEFLARCFALGAIDANSPYRAALKTVMAEHGLSDASRFKVPYDHSHERLFEGVPELLTALAEAYDLGIVANQSSGTEQRLREFGIRDHFAVVLASAELGVSKPDPEIFAEAERRSGRQPQHLVMIGDRLDNDILPAARRGWRTVHVRQGFSRFQSMKGVVPEDTLEVASVREVPESLPRVWPMAQASPALSEEP